MAILSASDRTAIRSLVGLDLSRTRESIAITKVQLQAAIDATDQWIDDNAAAYNAALPAAARNGLTAAQKARLFMAVTRKRFEVT